MKRLLMVVGSLVTALLALPILAVLAVASPGSTGGGSGSSPATTSGPATVAGIPDDYLQAFEAAGGRFGVPWPVLAGIYKLECDFGQSRLPGCFPHGSQNPYGAQGPGQFLPPTWRRGLGPHDVIPPGPPTDSTALGYATDGDADGVADPWDPADAIASTARLLAANGAAGGDVSRAVFAYNHDPTYVQSVLTLAAEYGDSAGSSGPLTGRVAVVLAFAQAQLGKPYLWGGSGPARWDCSGLVQAAYARAGLLFEHNAAAQYAATASMAVPLGGLQPGDLVFFGSSPPLIHHVGIYVGGGEMIDAPHTGAVVRIEAIGWPDLFGATRPLPNG